MNMGNTQVFVLKNEITFLFILLALLYLLFPLLLFGRVTLYCIVNQFSEIYEDVFLILQPQHCRFAKLSLEIIWDQ